LNKKVLTAPKKIVHAPVLVLVGPTAIGKTGLSLELARKFGCEIVNVDSMQVYRYMNIGTAKPTLREREGIRHHLIDIVDPDEQYSSALFVRDALAAVDTIASAGKIPLLTGGTGLYLKSLTEGLFGYEETDAEGVRSHLRKRLEREGRETLFQELVEVDPESAARIHKNDTQRLLRALEIYETTGKIWSSHLNAQKEPEIFFANLLQIGLSSERQMLYKRIEERTHAMLAGGLIEETEQLRRMGFSPELPSMQAIGYKHANNFLSGIWNLDDTLRMLIRDTRRYAKRQMTWFKKIKAIRWFERSNQEGIVQHIADWLADLHEEIRNNSQSG